MPDQSDDRPAQEPRRERDVTKLSVEKLLALCDKRNQLIESPVRGSATGAQGRLVPDPAAEAELKRIYDEIHRRVRARDPKLYRLVARRLRRDAAAKPAAGDDDAIDATTAKANEQVRHLDATARPIDTRRPIYAVSEEVVAAWVKKELKRHLRQAALQTQVRKPRRKKHKATKLKSLNAKNTFTTLCSGGWTGANIAAKQTCCK
jgi:hypothetical protein